MIVEDGKIEGDIEFNQDIQLKGMCTGTVTISSNKYLLLKGIITKDLIIESNASVDLHGRVSGNVINKGGKLHIYGVVYGSVTGGFILDSNAVVHGENT